MIRSLPYLAAFAVLALSGIVHGFWTDRWGGGDAVAGEVAALERVATSFGDWEGRLTPLESGEQGRAGLAGGKRGRYVHPPSGSVVSVLLVCGRPGPVSVHTPDVCYTGANFAMEGAPVHYRLPSAPAEFWTADFLQRESAIPNRLRIFWSWSARGAWQAPGSPRLVFGPERALYKLYVIRETTGARTQLADDPVTDFIAAFMPELEKALFPKT